MAYAIEEVGSESGPLGGGASGTLVSPLLSATGLDDVEDVEATGCGSMGGSCRLMDAEEDSGADMVE